MMGKIYYAFAILPPRCSGGFSWGTDRPHYVGTGRTAFGARRSLLDQIARETNTPIYSGKGRYGFGFQRLTVDEAWEHWTAKADVVEVGPATVEDALVAAPSAGDGDLWEDDVWLGIADYLSARTWVKLLVGPDAEPDYAWPNWGAVAASNSRSAVEASAAYLPPAVREEILREERRLETE